MILSDYEARLKAVNPRLHIKRYGTSNAGVHNGNSFVCRVPQGEIIQNNTYETRDGSADQYKNTFNPEGRYKFNLMVRRGRAETARILYTQKLIPFTALSKLS